MAGSLAPGGGGGSGFPGRAGWGLCRTDATRAAGNLRRPAPTRLWRLLHEEHLAVFRQRPVLVVHPRLELVRIRPHVLHERAHLLPQRPAGAELVVTMVQAAEQALDLPDALLQRLQPARERGDALAVGRALR